MLKDTQCEAWKTNGRYPLQEIFNKYISICSLHFLLSTQVIIVIIITNTMYCHLKTLYVLHVYMLM
jgi:hypothetical protein